MSKLLLFKILENDFTSQDYQFPEASTPLMHYGAQQQHMENYFTPTFYVPECIFITFTTSPQTTSTYTCLCNRKTVHRLITRVLYGINYDYIGSTRTAVIACSRFVCLYNNMFVEYRY